MSHHYRAVFLALVAIATVAVPATAINVVDIDDGTLHVIDATNSPTYYDPTHISDSSTGSPTTVVIQPGGGFDGPVKVFGTSLLQLNGGFLNSYVMAFGSAHIDIISGNVGGAGLAAVGVGETGTASIYGGVINGSLQAAPGGMLDLLGGSIAGDLLAGGGGSIVVHGTDFNMPLGSVQPTTGLLTGILADGTSLSVGFDRDFVGGFGSIILVPEPSSMALLIVAIASLFAHAWQRRRK